MSNPGGTAPVPYQQAGGGTVVDARSTVTHEFLNVVRHLTRKAGAYHSEDDLHKALRAIDSYSRIVLNGDHSRVRREIDHAEVEDASLRRPANYVAPAAPAGPPIDYDRLAAAIIAAQAAHNAAAAGPVHVITDVPAGDEPSAEDAAASQPVSEPLF